MVNLPTGLPPGKLHFITNCMEKNQCPNQQKKTMKNCSFYSRIGEIMTEIVNDYGVVWCASAGNHGLYTSMHSI